MTKARNGFIKNLRYLCPVGVIALGLVIIVGCGTSLQYVRNSTISYASRRTPSEVKIFYSEPKLQYESLGIINWDYYQPGWRAPSITDILPQLRKKVSEEGGDAIIIRKQEIPPLTERNLRVIAEVIRYKVQ